MKLSLYQQVLLQAGSKTAGRSNKMGKIQGTTYLSASEVLKLVRSGTSTIVIDVREDDRHGGHIKGSKHVPAPKLRSNPARYLALAEGKERIVFHCMFSQYRGPSSAEAFVAAWNKQSSEDGVAPEVCILSGGFNAVARLALQDKDLDVIEDFQKALYTTT